MNAQAPSINLRALLWTVGAHLLLLALFLIIRFQIVNPGSLEEVPAEELGMEVNLGSGPTGSGTDQPMNMDEPGGAVSSGGSPAEASAEREYTENNNADAEALHSSPSTRPSPATRTPNAPASRNAAPSNTRSTTTAAQVPRYSYPGAGNGGNRATENRTGTGEGPGNGPGDAGVAGGTPGAPNYSGTPGRGGGISHTLNRSLAQAYRLTGVFRNGGRVTAFITVNREGAIISSRIVKSPSGELTALAREKLRIIRYTASASAPPEQSGYIYLDFTTTGR